MLLLRVDFKHEILLDDFVRYAEGKNADYQDSATKQALDLLVSREVANAASNSPDIFKIGDSKFFLSSPQHDLGKWCMVALSGFSSNVKAGNGKLLLNVNSAFSAFYQPKLVSEYFSHFDTIGHAVFRNDDKGEKARKHLIGKRVQIQYNRYKVGDADKSIDDESRRVKTITGFSETFADQTVFTDHNKMPTNVWKFFRENHPVEAGKSSAKQFCVNTGSTKKGEECWYLPDQLKLVPGQIYNKTLDRLDPDMISVMIDFAARKPEENRDAIVSTGLPKRDLNQARQCQPCCRILESRLRLIW